MQRYLETERGMVEYAGGKWAEYDEAKAEIARLQSRLQAMTENAERLALGLEEAQYDNVDWRRH